LDTPEHVDSEKLNRYIFSKRGKINQKWNLSIFFKKLHSKTVSDVFHDLKNVKIAEKSLNIGQFLHILANFSHIL
jgi:hypothetical protein